METKQIIRIYSFIIFPLLIFLLIPGVQKSFQSNHFLWLYILLFSYIIANVATPVVRAVAARFNVVDKPGGRKIHSNATPLMGGTAVYVAFAITIIHNDVYSLELKGVAIGATIVFIMGLIDDIKSLPATLKLAIQVIATFVMIRCGVVADFLPNTWWGYLFEILITMIWVLGITNSLNFFDGMDGLATGLTVVSSLFIGLLAIQSGQHYLMYLSIALLGSSLGFLPYNLRYKQSASIFLGDGGSTFMGFMLASLTIMGGWGAKQPIKAYAMPVLILGILIFDMLYTTITRVKNKQISNFREWLSFTGKDHLHHRLEMLGFTRKQTVFFILFTAATLGLSALVLRNGNTLDALLLSFQAILIYLVIVTLMIRKKNTSV
ncbi:MAG: undecaprenyl/decaprenyl-phosphate alpha-N-acetylglucosaminyl 1-phosphate transferase [Planctomycetes bacterium]|nr:undecaprenyl/decaprenyl-phosphate alpha-N-acetylglucosaminyl 1-phosphate transferase [Planctomycetota bacterium]